jgi:hypothetical protein
MTAITEESARDLASKARREELLTVKEYAYIRGENPKSVYRRIQDGRQPGVSRVGRDIRIDITAATEPLDRRRRAPGAMLARFKRRLAQHVAELDRYL